MSTVIAAALIVPVADEAVKRLLRRGNFRTIDARLWLSRVARPMSRRALWTTWSLAAAALLTATIWLPGAQLFAGLILGGSLSNALESSIRGRVTDYVDLRIWPAFNLADVALTAGAIGLALSLAAVVRQALA